MNDWMDKENIDKAERLKRRGEIDMTLGGLAADVWRQTGQYDAGFEAGVLATENGLGRYDG